ncbi:hypothetical protein GGI25_005816 [Coemansia spiralis]|uniref:Uncharacterized protein n=1 Tax=Coemansia spiralis TaxID=417178 RepID=A0A9W8G277_9FUNG|nr:hypothetical protein GGI25_005816 [Coemansia spiralis]
MARKHTALLGKIQEVCLRSDYCSLRDAAEDDNTSSADLNEAVYLGHEFAQLIPSAISFEMFYFQNPMITLFEQVLAEKYALRISMIKCDSIVLKTVSCFSDKLAHATIDASHDHVTPLPRIHSRSLKTLTLMLATQKFLWESFEDVNSPGILDFSNLRFMSLCFGHDKPAFNSVSLDSRACKASYTVLVPKLICLEIFFCPLSLSFLLALVNYSSSLQKFYIRANGPVSFLFCNFKLSSLVKSRLVQYLPNVTQNGAISDWFSHANGLLSIPDVAEVAAIDIYNDTIIDLDLAQWTYLTEIHFFRPVTLSYIVDCVANMPYLIKVKAEWISVMLEDANRTVALPSLDILSARPVQLIVNMISVKFYGNGLSENLEEQHTNYLHSQIQNLRKIRCKRFL